MSKKKIIAIAAVLLITAAVVGWIVYDIHSQTTAQEISVTDAQKIVNTELDAAAISKPLKYIAETNSIKVNSISYGNEKDIVLDCTVSTIDTYATVTPHYADFLDADVKKKNSTMFKSSLDFKIEFEQEIVDLLKTAKNKEIQAKITLYDTEDGFKVHADNKTLNAVFGGIADIEKDIMPLTEIKLADGTVKKLESTNVNKGFVQCFEYRANTIKPETARGILKTWNNLKKDFEVNFIRHGRWKTIFKGLWSTIKLTFFALLIGIVIGFIVAFVRCTYLKRKKKGILLKVSNAICQVYLTITRGTPAVVQIMIIYFVIFMPLGVDKFLSAVVCFGLNSGAYVAEIVRGGIMNVDDGQTEAGRSLGFNYIQTMYHIVLPQAFKAVLPALANEFVVLLKETSIAFYIGLGDLMYAVNAIRSVTYSPFMPLISAAIIYLILVLGLSKLVSMLERRLRNNER